MKNPGWGEGEGGLNRVAGLINFPPLKSGGLFREGGGGLNRGFTIVFFTRVVSPVWIRIPFPFLKVYNCSFNFCQCNFCNRPHAWFSHLNLFMI